MSREAWLAHRHALVQLSRGRRRELRPPAPKSAVPLADRFATLFERAVRGQLIAFAKAARSKLHLDAASPLIKSICDLMFHYGDIISGDLTKALGKMGTDVNAHNAEQINPMLKRVTGVDPVDGPVIAGVLHDHRKANVGLIKGLTDEMLGRVAETLEKTQGHGVDAVTKALQEAVGFGVSRARLVARDQTLKLNGQLTKARHEEAGIERYTWVTAHDERVRHSHSELNGKDFSWDDPPIVDERTGAVGHPGDYFQCRCIAQAIVDLDKLEATAAPEEPAPEPTAPTPVVAKPLPFVPSVAQKPAPLPLPAPVVAAAPAKPAWWGKPVGDFTSAEDAEYNKLTQPEKVAYAYEADGETVPSGTINKLKAAGSKLFPHLTGEPAVAPVAAPVVAPAPEPTPIGSAKHVLPTWWHKTAAEMTAAEMTATEQAQFSSLDPSEQTAWSYEKRGKPVPPVVVASLKEAGSKLFPHLTGIAPSPVAVVAPKPTVAKPVAVRMRGKVVDAQTSYKLTKREQTMVKRNVRMAPAPTSFVGFSSMPISPNLEGVDFDEHHQSPRVHYSSNRLTPEYRDAVKAATKEAVASMSQAHIDAVENYTLSGYANMNEYLRDGHEAYAAKKTELGVNGDGWADGERKRVAEMHTAMAALPRAPSDMVLFRGLNLGDDEKQMNELAAAEDITVASFGSFTRNPGMAVSFARPAKGEFSVVYRITKHTNGVLLEGVSPHDENEVLLQPGTKLKVVGRQRVKENLLVIDLHEVSP